MGPALLGTLHNRAARSIFDRITELSFISILNNILNTFHKNILSDEEEAKVDKAEEMLEKYLSREGQVKTQIILSVSESLALMLQKQKTAKETWDALVTEMTKKDTMVLTSLQCQLRNMKCSEEDNLRQYLDKA